MPRFGETVLSVPVSVPVTAMVRQALGLASGSDRLDYELTGRLAGTGFGGVSFSSTVSSPFRQRGDQARPAMARSAGDIPLINKKRSAME